MIHVFNPVVPLDFRFLNLGCLDHVPAAADPGGIEAP